MQGGSIKMSKIIFILAYYLNVCEVFFFGIFCFGEGKDASVKLKCSKLK